MLPYTQNYNNAIRETDREIRGYLLFNGDTELRGTNGLISFEVHQDAMDDERFCIGSTTSSYCTATFFSKNVRGVSLANSYFDAYIGVVDGDVPEDPSVDYFTENVAQTTATVGQIATPPVPSLNSVLSSASAGDVFELVVAIPNGTYAATWNGSEMVFYDSGENIYLKIFYESGMSYFTAYDANGDTVSGTYPIYMNRRIYGVEYKCMGRFYVTEVSRGKGTTSVVAYDVASRLAVDYVPTVTRTSQGYCAQDILNDIVDQTSVNNGEHFNSLGANIYIPEIVKGTCKDQWGWLMNLCYNSGVCSFGSRTDLGYIEQKAYADGASYYNTYPALDDTVIYMDGLDAGDNFTINSITTGTDENPIVVGTGVGINCSNPYIDTAQATAIYNNLHGVTYTPMTISFRGDPCIEPLDSLKVTQDGTDYRLVVMRITTTYNGGLQQELECWGDSADYYAMSQGQLSAISSKVSVNTSLLEEMALAIETARNGVITQVLDEYGRWKELVIANNDDLSQATSVWRFNINGLAHSTSYTGGTYSFALDDQGRIVATRIQTGTLEDAQGKNHWNLDTGEFVITDGTFHVKTTASADNIIQLIKTDFSDIPREYIRISPEQIAISNVDTAEATTEYECEKISFYVNDVPGIYEPLISAEYTNEGVNLYAPDLDHPYDQPPLFCTLNADGLTFYNANGSTSAEFPAHYKSRASLGTITPYSSRGVVDSGGFYRVGSQCNINFVFLSSYTSTSSARITGMSAHPQFTSPLQAYDLTDNVAVSCYVNTSGNIYLNPVTSGHQYAIGGTFIL